MTAPKTPDVRTTVVEDDEPAKPVTRFLRQAKTHDFFIYSDHLAARNDMIEVDIDEVPECYGGTSKAKPRKPDVELKRKNIEITATDSPPKV